MRNPAQPIANIFMLAIFLMVSASISAQTTKSEFLSKWQNSKQFTLDVLNKMPESGMEYKTDPEAMSFKEQINHIGNVIVAISQGFLKAGEPSFSIDIATASKEELADYISNAYDYATASMKNLAVDDEAERLEVFGNTLTRRQVMAMMMDHSCLFYLLAKYQMPT